MTTYDIIGDVHGSADKLEGLLTTLGYAVVDGAHRREGHHAVFVGDLIDRGDRQVRVLEIVRAMDRVGSATVVMGNHEFNAIAWALPHPHRPGDYLRTHEGLRGARNRVQHRHFLDQIGEGSALHRSTVEWFRTLPLWFERDGLRVVHACWHQDSLDVLAATSEPGAPLSDAFMLDASTPDSATFDAVEVVLKGPEIRLPRALGFVDKDGTPRWAARIRWWDDATTSLRDAAVIPNGARTTDGAPHPGLPDIPSDHAADFRYTDAVPVFFGHYWFTGEPRPAGGHAVCTDYSAVRNGHPLVAYRWTGESTPTIDGFVSFPASTAPKPPGRGPPGRAPG